MNVLSSLFLSFTLALGAPPDDLAGLVRRLAERGDGAELALVEEIAAVGTPEAARALLEAYPRLASPLLLRGILLALPELATRAESGSELAAAVLDRLERAAGGEREPEVRLAAVEGLASLPEGHAALRRVVDSPAPEDARLRALELHVARALPEDAAWYRALVAPPEDPARARTPKSKREREAAEDREPPPVPLESLRAVAFDALALRLTPEETRDLVLREPNPSLRATQLVALERRAADVAVKVAEDFLEDIQQPTEVRVEAARLLARQRGSKVADTFLDLAHKQEVTPAALRAELAALLADMGDEKLTARLARGLGRGKPHERLFALLATHRLVDERVDKKRLEALDDDDPEVWAAALDVLAERRVAGARERLLALLDEGADPRRTLLLMGALDRLYDREPEWGARLESWLESDQRDVRNHALRLFAARKGVEAMPQLAAALAHPDWSTRLTALEGLERLRTHEAIAAIVARMPAEDGRPLAEFAQALWRLTGKPFRTRAGAWRDWWAAEGEGFEPLTDDQLAQLEAERRERELREVTATTFFGLRIESKRVVFVVDVSGSMAEALRGPFAEARGEPRLDAARRELARALSALPTDTLFNVVTFGGGVSTWLESADLSRERGREAALEYLSRLGALGGTNLYGALEVAFSDPEVDTIVLLSDGEPSVGRVVDPNVIREHVHRWNSDRHVEIDCVAVGGSLQILKWLAEDHGGTYIHIE